MSSSSSLPSSMRAVRMHALGGPSVLQVDNVPLPSPSPTQLLVRIAFAGLNYIDTYFRTGLYPIPLPSILGREASGTVVAVGSAVASTTKVGVGSRVVFFAPSTYAEYAAIDASAAIPIPSSVSFSIAAAAYMQGLTAHYLACSTYPVKEGDWVLVHAAAGGVGQLLVQIVKKKGGKVIATVGSQKKVDLVKALGADHVINYSEQKEWQKLVKETYTSGKGVKVVYDGVGATTWNQSLRSLSPRGVLVLYGNASGPVPPLDPLLLSANGSLFVTRPTLKDYIAEEGELKWRSEEVLEWVEKGDVKVSIGKEVELEQASEAHRLLEGRETTGKVLLKVHGE